MKRTVLLLALAGCTSTQRILSTLVPLLPPPTEAGPLVMELPPCERLISVSWRQDDLWALTRPVRAGEALPQTYKFIGYVQNGVGAVFLVVNESTVPCPIAVVPGP